MQSPVDHGHRLASCDTSLVVSGGADCGRRRRNVYDKTPQRYAKDNITAHLSARSDKSLFHDLVLFPISQHSVWGEISISELTFNSAGDNSQWPKSEKSVKRACDGNVWTNE